MMGSTPQSVAAPESAGLLLVTAADAAHGHIHAGMSMRQP